MKYVLSEKESTFGQRGLAMYLHEIPEGISLYITDAGSQSQGGSQWTVLTTPTLKLPEKELQMAVMLCKKLHYRSFGVVQFLDNENHAYHADHGGEGSVHGTYLSPFLR